MRRDGTAEGVVGSFGEDVEPHGVTAAGGGTPGNPGLLGVTDVNQL